MTLSVSRQALNQIDDVMDEYNALKFIEEVKKRTPLWNAEPIDKEEKLALWKDIGAAMFPDWDQINKAEAYDRVLRIQRKWRSLRDAYSRELRSRRSGIRINKRTYRYFKQLSFLGGYEGNVSDLDSEDDYTNQNTAEGSEKSDPLTKPKPKKPKKEKKRPRKPPSSENNEPEPPEQEFECPVYFDTGGTETDTDKLFLLSFVPEMKQLPVNIKMWARAQIANIMQEAVSSQYNNTMPMSGIKKREHSEIVASD